MDPLIEKLSGLSGGRILDVATSYGDFLRLLTGSFQAFEEAIGIDCADDRIEKALEGPGEKLRFEVMDAEKMEFADESFDTVAIRHSLHHLRNVQTVLKEMMRVLKPGGLFILCEAIRNQETTKENSIQHLHHWWAEVDRSLGGSHNDTFTREEILEATGTLRLNDQEIFEFLEETSESEKEKILKSMLKQSEEQLEKLHCRRGSEGLIGKGTELMVRYRKQGFTDEKSLYLFGRK